MTQASIHEVLPGRSPERHLASAIHASVERHASMVMSNPGKQFRARLVRLGYGLCAPDLRPSELEASFEDAGGSSVSRMIEELHAGSLVIDDIQDGSSSRREAAPLYQEIGIPLAINTGNYLYFRALDRVRTFGLEPEREIWLWRAATRVLIEGHIGQGLDLTTDFRSLSTETALLSALYEGIVARKTGALTGFAFSAGGLLNKSVGLDVLSDLHRLGAAFGDLLQRYDDILNLNLPLEHPKVFEDLRLGRPSYVWLIARTCGQDCHAELQELCRNGVPYGETMAWVTRWDLISLGLKLVDRRSESMRSLLRETPMSEAGRQWGSLEIDRILNDLRRAAASPPVTRDL